MKSSGIKPPSFIIYCTFLLYSVPFNNSYLKRSPEEIWVKENSSTNLSHYVPFPEAGPPITKIIFGLLVRVDPYFFH